MLYMRKCAKGCVKSVLVAMNTFCIIVALVQIVVAISDIQIVHKYAADSPAATACGSVAANVSLLILCLLLISVAGFGCLGAVKENQSFLYVYTVLLISMVAAELLLGVYTTVQRYGLEVRVSEWLRSDFYRNITDADRAQHRRQWDTLQYTFECCGVEGPEDYTALGLPVSISCCRRAYELKTNQGRQEHYELCLKNKSFEGFGCEDEILSSLRDSADILICIAIIALVFQGSGLVMAMWLTNYLRNEVKIYEETVKY